MKKFFTIILLNLLVVFCLPIQIYALDEGFYSTISFVINTIDKEGLVYKITDVEGGYTYDSVFSKSIADITDSTYQTRTYGQLDKVALPSYAQINIGYYWYNNTPNTVNVESVRIPLSRQIVNRGDITPKIYDIGFGDEVTDADILRKGGKYLEVEGPGLIDSDIGQEPEHGVVLATLTVRPPIEITEYDIRYISEHISEVVMHVRNNTSRDINNIWLNFEKDESVILDFSPYEEKDIMVYKKCILNDTNVNCGGVRIINRGTSLDCALYGSVWDGYINPDSVSVFSKIDNLWRAGAILRPTFNSFCIERIPYKYTTPELIVEIEQSEPEITDQQYWEQLLGMNILPITSKSFNRLDKYLTLLKPSRIDNLRVL
jgi:hypothetical protein